MSDHTPVPPPTLGLTEIGPGLPKVRSGVTGFDEISRGGLPRGRTTLLTGGSGTGKTLLGLQFLVAGARDYGEAGVLVTFEESREKITANVASLGFDLDQLQRSQMLVVDSFAVQPTGVGESGEFDLEPLFLVLGDSIDRIGATRMVLDTVEVLFEAFRDQAIIRSELHRLFSWLDARSVTAIVTGEHGERADGLTRYGIEEYVSDCVIELSLRMRNGIATRSLRIVKYRGSAHESNEYPFLITPSGFSLTPASAIRLDYAASEERIPTGVSRLDHMLSGGYFRGSTVLVSGDSGTGKSTLGAAFVAAACGRGERALLILNEEPPQQYLRNMRSVGLDLQPWHDSGLLRIWAARPGAYGLEAHLAIFAELVEKTDPSVVLLDGVTSLTRVASEDAVTSLLARQLDLVKGRGATAMLTALSGNPGDIGVAVSSLVDTWIDLSNVELNGERNRLLDVVKSRGTAHSNQVREFVLTDDGIALVDVYVGPGGVLTGSARVAREAEDRVGALQRAEGAAQRQRELQRNIVEREAQLRLLQDELATARDELERANARIQRDLSTAAKDEAAMAVQR